MTNPKDSMFWGSLSGEHTGHLTLGDNLWGEQLDDSRSGLIEAEGSQDGAADPAQGRVRLAPHLEVLGIIGIGGMGEVYRVADHKLHRIMAMKVLHRHLAKQTEIRDRFIEEAQATAQLEHPGILPVHELGELDDGRPYFTMKEVKGGTLKAVLAEEDEQAPLLRRRRLVALFARVCEIVGYAHSRGVTHRDLKPLNIMLGAFGEVLVLDWGLVKIDSREDVVIQTDRYDSGGQTRLGSVAGTPRYMSPEQARGEDVGIQSDVYSLGAILFEILVGESLQKPARVDDLLAAVSAGTGRRELPGDVPEDLRQIVRSTLALNPAGRVQDAGVLARAVQDWLDGAMARARALGVVQQALALEADEKVASARADSLDAQAKRTLKSVPGNAPRSEKRTGWLLEQEAGAARQEADQLELRRLQLLSVALSHSPEMPEALAALADHHHRKHAEAEEDRKEDSAWYHQQQLAFYERGQYQQWLDGKGTLTLHTVPAGATVTLHRFEAVDRTLQPGEGVRIGTTPLSAHPVAMGSYLAVLRHPDCEDVRYPLYIRRQEHWDGVPPGGAVPEPIPLPPRGCLGEQDIYVPAGWTFVGLKDKHDMAPWKRIWVEGFVIRKYPVTNREFISYLNTLQREGREDEALRWVPRARPGRTGELGAMVYGRQPDGTFQLVPDADGDLWLPDWPVVLVHGDAGRAYGAWLARKTGVAWMLPDEWLWEKAARGVDGRTFPWGDYLDPSFANNRDNNPTNPLPEVVDSFPVDQSPYGVRGMCGNVRDWCENLFQVGESEPSGPQRSVRGGCFFFWKDLVGNRVGLEPAVNSDTIGFRLVSRPPWLSSRR